MAQSPPGGTAGTASPSIGVTRLSDHSGLPPRLIRYVLVHRLVPSISAKGRGRGFARRFTPAEAILIATAAALLRGRIRRDLVRRAVLVAASDSRFHQATAVEIADGQWLRLQTQDVQTAWSSIHTGSSSAPPKSPMLVARLDLAPLRDRLT